MKGPISLALIAAFAFSLVLPMAEVFASDSPQQPTLIARERKGGRSGSRSGSRSGGRSGGPSRAHMGGQGTGRVNRQRSTNRDGAKRSNRGNVNLHNDRSGTGRVNRNRQSERNRNVDRSRNSVRNRNVENNRNVERNRNIDINNERNYSNRVNRNTVNVNRNNVVVNPRGWGSWGWNNGRPWSPNYNYWGGGFWGSFAAGAAVTGLTAAAINAANDDSPEYIVIQEGSPGNTLFSSYGLVQVQCVEGGNLVFIYGPQDSLICATPNSSVVAGFYDVNPTDMTLILR